MSSLNKTNTLDESDLVTVNLVQKYNNSSALNIAYFAKIDAKTLSSTLTRLTAGGWLQKTSAPERYSISKKAKIYIDKLLQQEEADQKAVIMEQEIREEMLASALAAEKEIGYREAIIAAAFQFKHKCRNNKHHKNFNIPRLATDLHLPVGLCYRLLRSLHTFLESKGFVVFSHRPNQFQYSYCPKSTATEAETSNNITANSAYSTEEPAYFTEEQPLIKIPSAKEKETSVILKWDEAVEQVRAYIRKYDLQYEHADWIQERKDMVFRKQVIRAALLFERIDTDSDQDEYDD